MKIRSITSFIDPAGPDLEAKLTHLQHFTQTARQRFQAAGFEVETTRLATTPFPHWVSRKPAEALAAVVALENMSRAHGFDYLSIGPARLESPWSYELVLPFLNGTQNVFMSGVIAEPGMGLSLSAVQACARIIEAAAKISPDGFTNLHFTVAANVPAWGPFFPAGFAGGPEPAFALALEGADAAVQAFTAATSFAEARRLLLDRLNQAGEQLEQVASGLAGEFGLEFKGSDFSLAPFPEEWCSIGTALERLGLGRLGQAGSVAAAAFLADTLDHGAWKRVGFNGLMLPVLEDSTMAERSENPLCVKDLLLFSAVCGTGLDTVPLPGNVTAAQLEGLLLDVGALALRLNKPLTARLMPVPGKKAGERTEFNFAYFSNGKVMALEAGPLSGVMRGEENVTIETRKART